jgi:hypothetical protein
MTWGVDKTIKTDLDLTLIAGASAVQKESRGRSTFEWRILLH